MEAQVWHPGVRLGTHDRVLHLVPFVFHCRLCDHRRRRRANRLEVILRREVDDADTQLELCLGGPDERLVAVDVVRVEDGVGTGTVGKALEADGSALGDAEEVLQLQRV